MRLFAQPSKAKPNNKRRRCGAHPQPKDTRRPYPSHVSSRTFFNFGDPFGAWESIIVVYALKSCAMFTSFPDYLFFICRLSSLQHQHQLPRLLTLTFDYFIIFWEDTKVHLGEEWEGGGVWVTLQPDESHCNQMGHITTKMGQDGSHWN